MNDKETLDSSLSIPLKYDDSTQLERIRILVMHVQMARRVAVAQHRLKKYSKSNPNNTEGNSDVHSYSPFSRDSRYLHLQPIPAHESQEPKTGCCSICSRSASPDIFEVVGQEESMIPYLQPIFGDWLSDRGVSNEDILDAKADEFGWFCCRTQGRGADREWQKVRADYIRGVRGPGEEREKSVKRTLFETGTRWDILG